MSEPLLIVSSVNRDSVFAENLMRSPDVRNGTLRVIAERGHSSAGGAYNAGLDRAGDASVVAFVHQDVYLPTGWVQRVLRGIAALDGQPWAVAGVWGVRPDGRFAGRVWCTGGGREHVGAADVNEVASLDEIVLLLNMPHRLRFDAEMPGFHLYATDVILQAREKGLTAYCIDAPVVHNSRCNPQPLDGSYRSAYRYMRRKWAHQLPLRTCVVNVTCGGWPMYRQWARNEIRRLRGKVHAAPPAPDPAAIAQRLGYEPVTR